jgi:prevent-host-death family protein
MKTVSARDANQSFSKLLAEVEAGAEITITKRGVAVARMLPVRRPLQGAAREEAIKRAIALMERGLPLGGRRFTRDEMHER